MLCLAAFKPWHLHRAHAAAVRAARCQSSAENLPGLFRRLHRSPEVTPLQCSTARVLKADLLALQASHS